MLLMLAKAAGIITISIGVLYFAMSACVHYAHNALDSDSPPATHPQLHQYMPEKLGNDPEHPVARLLEIDQCHTGNWVPDTPEITFQVQRIIDGDTILAHTSEQPEPAAPPLGHRRPRIRPAPRAPKPLHASRPSYPPARWSKPGTWAPPVRPHPGRYRRGQRAARQLDHGNHGQRPSLRLRRLEQQRCRCSPSLAV